MLACRQYRDRFTSSKACSTSATLHTHDRPEHLLVPQRFAVCDVEQHGRLPAVLDAPRRVPAIVEPSEGKTTSAEPPVGSHPSPAGRPDGYGKTTALTVTTPQIRRSVPRPGFTCPTEGHRQVPPLHA